MTLTISSRLEDVLAAPTESQAANPLEGAAARWIAFTQTVVDTVELKPSRGARTERLVRDPVQNQRFELELAERASYVEQARRMTVNAPESPIAFARLAQALVAFGDEGEATSAARKTISLLASRLGVGPTNSTELLSAKFVAARILAGVGDGGEAEAALAQLPGPGPWHGVLASLAVERGDYAKALDQLGEQNDPAASSLRGYLLLELRKPEAALAHLRAAMRGGDDSPALWANLAYAYASLGSPRKAVSSARRAVLLAPTDRQLNFNLANYLRAWGDPHAALAVLRQLDAARGEDDPLIAAAVAHAHLGCDQVAEGLRVLRRAQHHNSLEAASPQLAELNANYALLQWRSGQIDRAKVVDVLRDQLAVAGPTVPLLKMLADFAPAETKSIAEVVKFRSQLAESFSDEELTEIDVKIELLSGHLQSAARQAIDYAQAAPLDAEATVLAVYLRAYALGEYSEAADMGLAALRRVPANRMLINNTAFALALGGRAPEAKRILESLLDRDDPYLVATRGLVLIALGRVADGVAQYDRAASLINANVPADERDDFLLVLRANEAIALAQFGAQESSQIPHEYRRVRIPQLREHDPRFALLAVAAERAGVPLEPIQEA